MTKLLLDASVLLAAFDSDDDHHEAASALLLNDELRLATLDLARYEVANVAIRAWQTPGSVASLLTAIDKLADDGGVIASTTPLLTRAAELAKTHSISVHDAAYVAAAETTGNDLVSCDQRDLVSTNLATLPPHVQGTRIA